MTPLFSSFSSAPTVCNILFWIWKQSNFIFRCHSTLWSILVCRIPVFGQRLLIWTSHHTFLKSRHHEVTKNLYYVLSTCRSQIPIFFGSSSWTIFLLSLISYKDWGLERKHSLKLHYRVLLKLQFRLLIVHTHTGNGWKMYSRSADNWAVQITSVSIRGFPKNFWNCLKICSRKFLG